MDMTGVRWRKSSRSGNGGNTCVEVARIPGSIAARDSTNPDGGMLTFTPDAFGAFLTAIKQSRHDL